MRGKARKLGDDISTGHSEASGPLKRPIMGGSGFAWSRNWASRAASSVFFTTATTERLLVHFRIGASPVLVLVLFLERSRLPYWELAVGGFAVVFVANLLLRPLLRQGRSLIVASIGTCLDTALLLSISTLAIAGSAVLETTTDMWLIYPLVIVLAAYRFRAAFSILYTFLLSAWYGAHIVTLMPPTSRAYIELPVRLGFFLLMGVMAPAMAHGLRRQGEEAAASRSEADGEITGAKGPS